MAKRLDQIIVIDLEATCWENSPPEGQESEIIEIGLCLVDVRSAVRGEKHSIFVRPERSQVSEFCTRLTTLTQEQVETGVSFKDACALLRTAYFSKDRMWASYGDYDRHQFERQCLTRNTGYPFGPTHLNVKNLFAIVNALPHEIGMAEALQLRGLALEGTHHRADDDAWNISALLVDILRRQRSTEHDIER